MKLWKQLAKAEVMTGKPLADPCSRAEPLEGLKGDSEDEAEELDGFGSEGGRGWLGGTIHNKGDLVLGLTSDDLKPDGIVAQPKPTHPAQ